MRIVRSHDLVFVPAAHEDPKKPGVLKKVIATGEQILDGKIQMINWAKLPAGRSFRPHYHEDMEETFIIIRGEATMKVGDKTCILTAGDTIVVAPHEIHEMHNRSKDDVEYVVIGVSTQQGGQTIVVET